MHDPHSVDGVDGRLDQRLPRRLRFFNQYVGTAGGVHDYNRTSGHTSINTPGEAPIALGHHSCACFWLTR